MKINKSIFCILTLTAIVSGQLSAMAGPWQREVERLEAGPDNHITRSMLKLAREKAAEEEKQEQGNQSSSSESSTESSESSNVMDGPGCDNPLILC